MIIFRHIYFPIADLTLFYMLITIGSRDSTLAMIQANWVKGKLESLYPQHEFQISSMATLGDKILETALHKVGSKALFTKELEVALDAKQVDLIVHSLKDLPTALPPGLCLAAVTERENPVDVVIMNPRYQQYTLATLPSGSVIGSSSVRRLAQLKRLYPHLAFQDVRGNLNTRLKKLDDSDSPYAGLLLAYAGVHRMGWDDRITQELDMFYAVGQGALGIECRENDDTILEIVQGLIHHETLLVCLAEREFMRTLQGGCSVPIGVSSSLKGGSLELKGCVTSVDGKEQIVSQQSIQLTGSFLEQQGQAELVGRRLGLEFIELGVKRLLP